MSLVSDYRFRGRSLSDGQPELQLNLAYDNPGNWYLGAFASRVALGDGGRHAQLLGYAGYSRRLPSGSSWEIGATESIFSGAGKYDYAELFAGFASERVNGRVYFSPRYFGAGYRTLYAELNASYPLRERVHLLGHVGVLHYLSKGEAQFHAPERRADFRIGVGAGLADWNLQLAWVGVEKTAAQSAGYDDSNSRAIVLNLSYSF